MNLHANAQTCPHCRSLIVSRVMDGQMPVSAAQDFRVSIKAVVKWVARFRGATQELERWAVELYARGLSTRDIEDAFTDETG